MPNQIPPGRAGRPWLLQRIAVATHGVELLRSKQRLLSRERRRLLHHREEAAREFCEAVAQADRWARRADILSGAAATAQVGATLAGRARVEITWRNTMGVLHPDRATVTVPDFSGTERAALNSAMGPSREAHVRALEAAARTTVAQSALRAVEAELAVTQRRLRAIERHRLQSLHAELRSLELRLDEVEREERLVTRWAAGRRDQRGES
jgi:V/A-type H+/Na+-transporting ATPase subunit D